MSPTKGEKKASSKVSAHDCEGLMHYLDRDPKATTPEDATALLTHVSGCERCARQLESKSFHALHLLANAERNRAAKGFGSDAKEAAKEAEHDKIRGEILTRKQKEYVIIAKAALSRLEPSIVKELSEPVADRLDRSAVSHVDAMLKDSPQGYNALLRLVLCQVEMSVSLMRFAGSGQVTLATDGSLETKEGPVPVTYFASLLEPITGISEQDTNEKIWKAMVEVVVSGTLGMPGLAENHRRGGGIVLSVARDPIPAPLVEKS